MRRFILAASVLAVLVGSGAAYAATQVNSYTASYGFKQSKAGTKKSPVPLGLSLTYTAKNNTAGDRAAPLKDIKTVLDGVNTNSNDFPTCSANKIEQAKNDNVCPKAAMVAKGSVESVLGSGSTLAGPGTPCDPLLDVWNGGHNKDVYFFVIAPGHACGGLQTGASAPYVGTAVNKGGNMDVNVPLPPDVSTDAGNVGLYGSLIHETLTYSRASAKVHGKKVPMFVSTGCKAGKHDTTTVFTAQTSPSGAEQSETVKYDGKC